MPKEIVPIRRSAMHKAVLALVKSLYPNYTIQNEVPVAAGRTRSLPADIAIRDMKVVIECQGIQHFEYTPHFHKSPQDFAAQQQRDREKASAIWAAGWSLVTIRFDEYERLTKTKLARLILKALKEKH